MIRPFFLDAREASAPKSVARYVAKIGEATDVRRCTTPPHLSGHVVDGGSALILLTRTIAS